ncbi:MAG: hypothetical protein U1D55_04455 [Phycisphaerae bacterium]
MKRETWLALLVLVNLALAVALVSAVTSPQAALAQATGLSGNYLAVAGEIQDAYDVVYLLDARSRALHAITYDKTQRRLVYQDSRDLDRDFRNNRN